MLEQFQVPDDVAVRVPVDNLRDAVRSVFLSFGMSHEHAERSTEVLLYSDIRGIDTHGVSNMLKVYVERMQDGSINIDPKWRIVRESNATCTIDSDGAHGGVIGPIGMEIAISRAREHGVGVVNVFNGGHFGAAAFTAAMALQHDMIGISMCTGGLQMTPTYAAEALVGLNPIAVAVPTEQEIPFIFDASMSGVAGNKIRLLSRLERGALPGWIAEPDGDPIMDERPVPEGFLHLPLGGTRELGSHKGFGLALMIEVLSSVLSGAAGGPDRRARQCHQFIALRVNAFCELRQFKQDMDKYLQRIVNAKLAPGHDRVFYAGVQEHEEERERRARGVPLHPDVVEWLDQLLEQIGSQARLR